MVSLAKERGHRLRRARAGQCAIELVIGLICFVPLAMFLIDVFSAVAMSSINDTLAKSAARAAANQQTQHLANVAAQHAINRFPVQPNGLVRSVELIGVDYHANNKVAVRVALQTALPAPLPFLNSTPRFLAQAVEPIVAASH